MMGLGSWFRSSRERLEWRCKTQRCRVAVSDRQERIAGWDQQCMSRMRAFLIGAGGIGGLIADALVRKGAGQLSICDHDTVAPENLNRQRFKWRDCYQNKAIALCRNLSEEGVQGTRLIAHPCSFQELDHSTIKPDVIVVGVDNQMSSTRLEVCHFALMRSIPAVFVAVSADADAGYVMVQKPDEACWECALKSKMTAPAANGNGSVRCPATPASIDILLLVVGHATYALDTLVMKRPRNWNYVYLSLARPVMNCAALAPRRPDCAACGESCA